MLEEAAIDEGRSEWARRAEDLKRWKHDGRFVVELERCFIESTDLNAFELGDARALVGVPSRRVLRVRKLTR